MLVLSHGAHASPAARVYAHVWRGGVVMRDQVVDESGLSAASVSRAVAGLVDEGLVRPRPDMGRVGAAGRPSVPLQLDGRRHAVVGVHVGRVTTTVAVADLRARVLDSVDVATPQRLDDVADLALAALARLGGSDRLVVSAGAVGPWTDLGIDRHVISDRLAQGLGVEVATADHITAAATAEHVANASASDGLTAYVYARDTIGFAVVEPTPVGTIVSRASRLTHLPTGSGLPCGCRSTGCLEATASDRAVALRAVGEGLIAEPRIGLLDDLARAGSARAHEVLHDRAMVLGRAAGFVRDMSGCDRLVLIGQAFTGSPGRHRTVVQGFEQATSLSPIPVEIGHHGPELQAVGACSVALVPFQEDPLGRVVAARRHAL